jgi:hypothetical protein
MQNEVGVKLEFCSNIDDWKKIVANAKFTEINQLLMTKIGINNFINVALSFKTSILLRDIIVNSPYVSAWARSSQVLNASDSKFSVYQSSKDSFKDFNNQMISQMEILCSEGHLMDDIRMIIPLGSFTNYAINVDIMTLVKLILVLECIEDIELKAEADIIYNELKDIIFENFGITEEDIEKLRPSYLYDLEKDFQYCCKDLSKITGIKPLSFNVTYSVVGQILRHRTIYKNTDLNLKNIQELTSNYDYNFIETPPRISVIIKENNSNITSLYQLMQGSIINLSISGYKPAIQKMFNQRSCCINDTKQFAEILPKNAIPPCKCNVKKFGCYVDYVNNSRLKNEEQTQVPCPIWAENKGISDFTNNNKYEFFYNQINSWKKWKQKLENRRIR